MTPATHGSAAATSRQLAYLKSLATRTGQSFAWPHTRSQASREIRRLKATDQSSRAERAVEHHDWRVEAAAREANCDVPIQPHELQGYGSSATWREQS